MDSTSVRLIYREACHGAGANVRNECRRMLEEEAAAREMTVWQLLDELSLDWAAYRATAPIYRDIRPGN